MMDEFNTSIFQRIQALAGSEPVIFEDEDAPKPKAPFWTITVQSIRQIGRAGYSQGVTNGGEQTVFIVYEATVSVQRIGKGSESKVIDFKHALSKQTVQDAFFAAKISVFDTSEVVSFAYKLDNGKTEPRASLDLFTRFGGKENDQVGIIDTAEISATLDNGLVDLVNNVQVNLG